MLKNSEMPDLLDQINNWDPSNDPYEKSSSFDIFNLTGKDLDINASINQMSIKMEFTEDKEKVDRIAFNYKRTF